MAIFRCKICGGTFEIDSTQSISTCEYCGVQQTIPKLDNDRRANLYDRANHFRRNNDFDKALEIYERILSEDVADAEAHWCCALCRFGIEYVQDPATKEWVPTCHRASYDSFLQDVDYLATLDHSDALARQQYQKDAARIAEVQRGILATSQNAEPYDVFICYKESDERGQRTRDSLLAQEIYYQLIEQGKRVFFARITLEDIVGSQYEPYIFAALNSAKVMIVVGTKAEYMNAVWVKNEWSRFLAMMKKDRSKILLPCYRDMDPYDMPEQLSVLQSYDMSKIGFIQDLIRGVNKIVRPEEAQANAFRGGNGAATKSLLEKAFLCIEEGDFCGADEYCEKALDVDPRCAMAYLGKLMVDLKVNNRRKLALAETSFAENVNYMRLVRFGSEDLVEEINQYLEEVKHAEKLRERRNQEAKRIQEENQRKAAAEAMRIQVEKEAEQRRQQAAKAEEAKQREAAIRARRNQELQMAELVEKYNCIPTKAQIKKNVKQYPAIKRLKVFAIIFLFVYWPVGLILFAVRSSKIKKAVKEENARYDHVRQEYTRMLSQRDGRRI